MVDVVTKRLRANNKQALNIGLAIGYSKNIGGGFYHTIKVESFRELITELSIPFACSASSNPIIPKRDFNLYLS
mgnify:CR=1 FL=1